MSAQGGRPSLSAFLRVSADKKARSEEDTSTARTMDGSVGRSTRKQVDMCVDRCTCVVVYFLQFFFYSAECHCSFAQLT